MQQFQPTRSYATRKTVAEGLLDIALLLANASQLKAMVTLPSDRRDHFFVAQIVLIGLSILLQARQLLSLQSSPPVLVHSPFLLPSVFIYTERDKCNILYVVSQVVTCVTLL